MSDQETTLNFYHPIKYSFSYGAGNLIQMNKNVMVQWLVKSFGEVANLHPLLNFFVIIDYKSV